MPRGIASKLIIYLTVMVIIVEGVFAFVDIESQEAQLLREMNLGAELVSRTMVNATWDGTDQQGQGLASGVYLARMTTETGTSLKRLTLVR
jgi:flagellar hook assembly protein FlgD